MLYFVLCSLVVASHAMILCPPNFCDSVKCPGDVTAELCDGRFDSNGGMCGCCPSCVKQLGEGENCRGSFLLGVPAKAECGTDLYCNPDSMKCQPQTCAMVRADRDAKLKESLKKGEPLLGLQLPECEKDGSYKPKQCIGSMCMCVSSDGKQIENYVAHIWESDDMKCNCAREKYEYKMIGKMFFCDAKGNYESVQCTGSVCGCADENGALLTDTQSVPIWMKDSLNC